MKTPSIVAMIALLLCGCVPEEGNNRPWRGYAWNGKQQRSEYFFSHWEAARDCREGMLASIARRSISAECYSTPIGCTYTGNNYWIVRLMSAWEGADQIGCIRKSTNAEAAKGFYVYGPALKSFDQRTESSYCV